MLLEREEDLVDEFVVSKADLPEQSRHQDAVLDIRIKDDQLIEAEYDREETKTRKEEAQSRFDHLAERPPKGDEQ